MAEYIEKRLALEELENLRQKCEMHDDCDELIARKCKKAVSLLPVADVAPVIHAKWENITVARVDTTGYCSECKNQAVWRTSKPYNICPNCGAKMDGGGNNMREILFKAKRVNMRNEK